MRLSRPFGHNLGTHIGKAPMGSLYRTPTFHPPAPKGTRTPNTRTIVMMEYPQGLPYHSNPRHWGDRISSEVPTHRLATHVG